MPPPDGMAVWRQLKNDAHAKAIPVVFMTAKSEQQIQYSGLHDVFLYSYHLRKPFDRIQLIRMVERNVAKKSRR
jgi:CheY-like chemotaxis protein